MTPRPYFVVVEDHDGAILRVTYHGLTKDASRDQAALEYRKVHLVTDDAEKAEQRAIKLLVEKAIVVSD